MTRKQFVVGDILEVTNGLDTLFVTVEYVNRTGRSIFVGGDIRGKLKYYKNLNNYTVSRGMTNGKVNPLERYELVA
jgi:hypothetical protein